MLGQKCGSIRSYAQSPCLVEHRYPLRHLIIPQGLRIHYHPHLGDGLVERLSLVCAGPVHSYHQDCRLQRLLTIYGKFLKSLHHLSLLHHHKLTFCKHRITSGSRNHSISIHIRTVAHSLIEIPLALVKTMLHYRIAHHIDIIRLISHKKIHRLEHPVAGILHNLPAKGISIRKTFCHKIANIIFSAEISSHFSQILFSGLLPHQLRKLL